MEKRGTRFLAVRKRGIAVLRRVEEGKGARGELKPLRSKNPVKVGEKMGVCKKGPSLSREKNSCTESRERPVLVLEFFASKLVTLPNKMG